LGKVLFVHGMGHDDDRNYWKKWAVPLRLELAGQGLDLKEEQWEGVYYYDLMPGPGKKADQDQVVQVQLINLKEKVSQDLYSLRASGTRKMETVRRIAELVVDNFGDIIAYLYFEQTHQAVNQRLYEAIAAEEEPVNLIGYSLGSIVSYCALKQNRSAARKVAHLILLGSPLFWFRHGVAGRVGLELKPAVGRLTNIAGMLDIAWPQAVPNILHGLDQNIEFMINPFDPVRGHQEYFCNKKSLSVIASEIKKGWDIACPLNRN